MGHIDGSDNNDIIIGSTNRDKIGGRRGDDLVYAHGAGLGVGEIPPAIDTAGGGPDDPGIVSGGRGNDSIQAATSDITLDGGRGDDILTGDDGDDTLSGGRGDDILIGGGGDDTLDGGRGNDTLDGGDDDDTMDGGRGDDTLDGGGGDDTMDGGRGDDTLDGGDGDDTMDGGRGKDTLDGGDGDDTMDGGRGEDTLDGGDGGDTLDGGRGSDTLDGGEGDDDLRGGRGEDTLDGGAGDDDLDAGRGDDFGIYRVSENIGAIDFYDGGLGFDTLRLVLTQEQSESPEIQADIAAFQAFLAENSDANSTEGPIFQFTAFDLQARNWEALDVVVEPSITFDIMVMSDDVANDTPTQQAMISEEDAGDNAATFRITLDDSGTPLAGTNTASVTVSIDPTASTTENDAGGDFTAAVIQAIVDAANAAGIDPSNQTPTNVTLTWEAGDPTTLDVVLTAFDDDLADSPEELVLALSDAMADSGTAAIVAGKERATATIEDGEEVTFDIMVMSEDPSNDNPTQQATISEEDTSDNAATFQITLDGTPLTGTNTASVTVSIDPTSTTEDEDFTEAAIQAIVDAANAAGIDPSDQTPTSVTLTWEAGDPTTLDVVLTAFDDDLTDSPEDLVLALSDAMADSGTAALVLGKERATATIEDIEEVTFDIMVLSEDPSNDNPTQQATISEEDTNDNTATFLISLGGTPLTGTNMASVTVAIGGDTENEAGGDFTQAVVDAIREGAMLANVAFQDNSDGTVTLTWDAGSSAVVDVVLTAFDDDLMDSPEDLILALSDVMVDNGTAEIVMGKERATGTIIDNDPPPPNGEIIWKNGGEVSIGDVSALQVFNIGTDITAPAPTDTWIDNSIDRNWSTPGNWEDGTPPTGTDHVAFDVRDSGGTNVVDPAFLLIDDGRIASLTYTGAGRHTTDLDGGSTLQVDGPVSVGIDNPSERGSLTVQNGTAVTANLSQLNIGRQVTSTGTRQVEGSLLLVDTAQLDVGTPSARATVNIGVNESSAATSAATGLLDAMNGTANLHVSELNIGRSLRGQEAMGTLKWDQQPEAAIDATMIFLSRGSNATGVIDVAADATLRLGTADARVGHLLIGRNDINQAGAAVGVLDMTANNPTFEAFIGTQLELGRQLAVSGVGTADGSLILASNSLLEVGTPSARAILNIGVNDSSAATSAATGLLDAMNGTADLHLSELNIGRSLRGQEAMGTLKWDQPEAAIDATSIFLSRGSNATGVIDVAADATLRLGTADARVGHLLIGRNDINQAGAAVGVLDMTANNPTFEAFIGTQLELGRQLAVSGVGTADGSLILASNSLLEVGTPSARAILNIGVNDSSAATSAATGLLDAMNGTADLHLSELNIGRSLRGQEAMGTLKWDQPEAAIDATSIFLSRGSNATGVIDVAADATLRLGTADARVGHLLIGRNDINQAGAAVGVLDMTANNPTFEAFIGTQLELGRQLAVSGVGTADGSLILASNSLLEVGTPSARAILNIGVNDSSAATSAATGLLDATNGTADLHFSELNIGRSVRGQEAMGTLILGDNSQTDSTLVNIGIDTNAVGTLDQIGGNLNAQTVNFGEDGTLNLVGGILTADLINLDGGTFNFTGGRLQIGTFDGTLDQDGGTLAPGTSPGIANIDGGYNLASPGTLEIELDGTTVDAEFDQVVVIGEVDLNADTGMGGMLDVIPGFAPNIGDSFLIIDNDLTDPIVGTFKDLPEGAMFDETFDGDIFKFQITYIGGDGNDVVLTAVPTPPPEAIWTNDAPDNLWQSPANWNIDAVPPPDANVIIPDTNGPAIHNGDTGTTDVGSLTASEVLNVQGGTLNLGSASTIEGNGTLNLTGGVLGIGSGLNVDGQFNLDGGTVRGGLLVLRGTTNVIAGILDDVTLDGAFELGAFRSGVAIFNDLRGDPVNGAMVTLSGDQTLLSFGDSQTLSNVTVVFDSGGGGLPVRTLQATNADAVLTLATDVTIKGGMGQIISSGVGSAVVNKGTISANVDNQAITIDPLVFTNEGIVEAIGSSALTLAGQWDNDGRIELFDTAKLTLAGSFSTGDIGVIDRDVDGDDVLAGMVTLIGDLDNTGTEDGIDVLLIDAQSGSWDVDRGRITGGTLRFRDGEQLNFLAPTGSGSRFNTLDDVTLDGDLNLSNFGAAVVIETALSVDQDNGATVTLSGAPTRLLFVDSMTFDDATVVFDHTNAGGDHELQTFVDGTVLTLGENLTVVGGRGRISSLSANNEVINKGTISANVDNQAITIDPLVFTNEGIVEAIGSSALTLAGQWDNDGRIELFDTAKLTLAGSFSTGDIGVIDRDVDGDDVLAGMVTLIGDLDNTGTEDGIDVLLIDAQSGSWDVDRGRITGGTLRFRDGEQLNFLAPTGSGSRFNTLDDVTLDGDLNLSNFGAAVVIETALSVDQDNGATVTLSGAPTRLLFVDSMTFDDATVVFDHTNAGGDHELQTFVDGTVLTLGENLTVVGGRGRISSLSANNEVINKGTISANVDNQAITIDPLVFTNEGIVEAIGGGNIVIDPPAFTNEGTLEAVGGGTMSAVGFANSGIVTVEDNSTIAVIGGVLDNEPTGVINLNGGTLTAENINLGGGSFNFVGGRFEMENFDGTLDQDGGVLAPGVALGIATIDGGYNLASPGTLEIELNGTTAGTQFDQVVVIGEVDLNADAGIGGMLDVILEFAPNIGESFLVIDNDEMGAIVGNFEGLPEGAMFDETFGGNIFTFQITYAGGDGNNDVVLTTTAVTPAAAALTGFTPSAAAGEDNFLIGTSEADVFVFKAGSGPASMIDGFETGADSLELQDGVSAAALAEEDFDLDGTVDTVLDLDNGNTVVLLGITGFVSADELFV